jgi:hypothetical protein
MVAIDTGFAWFGMAVDVKIIGAVTEKLLLYYFLI